MSAILSWLAPWWAKAALAAVVLAMLAYGVHSYNKAVSAKAVIAALKDERAKTQPIIDELANRIANADKTITDYKAASDKLKAQVAVKQQELGNAIKRNGLFKSELAKLRGADAEFIGLLNTISGVNSSATSASAGARLVKLGSAYSQCEKEYRASRIEHAETLVRLDEALSVVRALK